MDFNLDQTVRCLPNKVVVSATSPSSPCPSLQSGDSGLEVKLGQVYGRSRRGVRDDRMFGLE